MFLLPERGTKSGHVLCRPVILVATLLASRCRNSVHGGTGDTLRWATRHTTGRWARCPAGLSTGEVLKKLRSPFLGAQQGQGRY